jgi:hypothetical protein
MRPPMTDPIAQVEAVLEAATPGPWDVFEKRVGVAGSGDAPGTARRNLADVRYKNGEADARAIALARNLMPDALAVVRAAEEVLAEWDELGPTGTHETIGVFGRLRTRLSTFRDHAEQLLGGE